MTEDSRKLLREFISSTEKNHFRTDSDTGSHPNALFVWNILREYAGLIRLDFKDLPAYCMKHETYHIIREGYECFRSRAKNG